MRSFGLGLLALLAVAFSVPSIADDTPPVAVQTDVVPETGTKAQGAPGAPWAPGSLLEPGASEPVGRYHARGALMSFTLPESWREKDVVVRELVGDQLRNLQPSAEAAVVIDYQPESGKARTLVTIYRLPLAAWRKLEDAKTANFGRMTMNTQETAYVVDRPEDADGNDRYAQLRNDLEDLLITLAVYNPVAAVAALRRPVADSYLGKLPGGEPVTLELAARGTMKLTLGKAARVIKGQWMQRNNQVIMQPLMDDKTAATGILMHFDNHTLVVVSWDEKAFGPAGARLDPAE